MEKWCQFLIRRRRPEHSRIRRIVCLAIMFSSVSFGPLFAGLTVPVSGIHRDSEQESFVAIWEQFKQTYGVEDKQDGFEEINPVSQQKQRLLTGVVTGENRDTLPGVNVMIKGTKIGVVTDVHGKFSLPLPVVTDDVIICFSFIGKRPKEIKFTGQTHLNVMLEDEDHDLDEVIVTGRGNVPTRYNTGAVTSLKMDDIMMPGVSTVDKMLEGHVPGMIFMQNSGQVGATPRVRVRGTSTILGSQEPLWVIDGIIQTDPVNVDPSQINDLDFVNLLGNAISGLNPNDIESIDVLKDAASTAMYGSRASNGVIVVTTKKGKMGPPQISYSFAGTLTTRSRYTNRAMNVMNSKERVDYSREMIEKGLTYPNISAWVGYEGAVKNYYEGNISYDQFVDQVSYLEKNNTDWLDLICRDAFSHNHTLSLSGGTANMKYYASLGYNRENGILRKEGLNRYTAAMRLNLNYERFNVAFSMTGNVQEKKYTPSEMGLMDYAYNTSRAVPAYAEDGSYYYYAIKYNGSEFMSKSNILKERDESSEEINGSGITLTTQLGYKIFPELKAELTFSYTVNNTEQETYYSENSGYASMLRGEVFDVYDDVRKFYVREDLIYMPFGGELRKASTKTTSYTLRGTLTYSKFLDEHQRHLLTASAGFDINSNHATGLSQTFRGYLKDRGHLLSTTTDGVYPKYDKWLLETQAARGVLTDNLSNVLSGYASLSYILDNVYTFNANIGIDASNKFGSKVNNKLLPAWSLSARWDIKRDLLENWGWVNGLNWRASFGYTGNMTAEASPNMVIKQGGHDAIMNNYSATVYTFPNPNLSWEKKMNINTSMDFSFLRGRISGSFSYFYSKTENALLQRNISYVNGVRSYKVNQGIVENQGVEFAFSFLPVLPSSLGTMSGGKKGFYWRIDPQIGQVLNKLINKAISKNSSEKTLHDDYTYRDFLNGNAEVEGRPLNSFFSYEFTGLDPKNGAPTFARIGEEEWDTYMNMTNDEVCLTVMNYSGCRVPYLQGGISNTIGYGNFVLSCNFAYSIGSKVRLLKLYNNVSSNTPAPQPMQNIRREMVNRWKVSGDERRTNIPALLSDSDYAATMTPWWRNETFNFGKNIWEMYNYSDIRVVSGNYLKLQNLNLRYNVPADICKRMGLASCYLSFSTSNLFTWCAKELKGQDPTSQSGSSTSISVPVRPAYTFNVNVSF